MRRVLMLIALITLAITGCAATEMGSRIKQGMTRQEVIRIMGHPDETSTRGEFEALRYKAKRSPTGINETLYQVVLKNGRVVQQGGETVSVRDRNGNIILFAPSGQ